MTYRLEDRSRLGRMGLAVAALIVASFSAYSPADTAVVTTADTTVSLNEWADLVWDAGIDGDVKLDERTH